MKYAVIGPRNGIIRISETEPKSVNMMATVIEITDEQAATIEEGRLADPKVLYFIVDGALKTKEEKLAIDQAARSDRQISP